MYRICELYKSIKNLLPKLANKFLIKTCGNRYNLNNQNKFTMPLLRNIYFGSGTLQSRPKHMGHDFSGINPLLCNVVKWLDTL